MKFPHEQFFNIPLECVVLATVHQLPGLPNFKSFNLYGNVDHPVRLDLYTARQPAYNDAPCAIYDLVGGVYVLRPPEAVVRRVRQHAVMPDSVQKAREVLA